MSSKLGTKNLQTSSVSKTLLPGNSVCKINSINLEEFQFKQGAYQLVLNLESEPVGGTFEGFFIDKEDESKGRYYGQVAKVRAHKYAYSDSVTKGLNPVQISRDQEIMKFIKKVCDVIGSTWVEEADAKYDTIEEFVEAFNDAAPFRDKYLNFCLYGKEYKNKQGYINYDLFLPKFSKEGVPFEATNVKLSKLLTFNSKDGIIGKVDTEKVSSFDADEANNPAIQQDFSL